MVKYYHPDPLARYLRELPGAPLNLKMPGTVWPLFAMVPGGFKHPRANKPIPVAELWWDTHVRTDAMLRAWVESEASFVAPERWPPAVAEVFPPWVTPEEFASAVMPDGHDADRGALLHHCPNLHVLSAYAHGWPVRPHEHDAMREGAKWLMECPLFVVWAYDLDTSVVPGPFSDAPLWRRLKARAELVKNPLSLGNIKLRRALPESLRDRDALVGRLPRRSEGVGPSPRLPRLRRRVS